jgi:ribosomal protein S21
MQTNVTVFVRGGDVERAIRRLRKQCQYAGVIADMRRGEFYRKPGEAKVEKLFG